LFPLRVSWHFRGRCWNFGIKLTQKVSLSFFNYFELGFIVILKIAIDNVNLHLVVYIQILVEWISVAPISNNHWLNSLMFCCSLNVLNLCERLVSRNIFERGLVCLYYNCALLFKELGPSNGTKVWCVLTAVAAEAQKSHNAEYGTA
jgi:hypothetical protein